MSISLPDSACFCVSKYVCMYLYVYVLGLVTINLILIVNF